MNKGKKKANPHQEKWVKHVIKEGSKKHVVSHDSFGRHCNVNNCEINEIVYGSGKSDTSN